jgi:hypothetical protein
MASGVRLHEVRKRVRNGATPAVLRVAESVLGHPIDDRATKLKREK